jgi:hypothetical protein
MGSASIGALDHDRAVTIVIAVAHPLQCRS